MSVSTKTMMITRCETRLRDNSTLPSFRMIPIHHDCPFLMAEFDPTNSRLVILHKEKKEELQAIPAINDSGEFKKTKTGATVVERRTIPEWFELHISDNEGIIDFIKHMAINHENGNLYMPYISKIQPISKGMETPPTIIKP